jgi:hypothetical protein
LLTSQECLFCLNLNYLLFVFWYRCIYRIVKLNKDIKALEETEKRLKEE